MCVIIFACQTQPFRLLFALAIYDFPLFLPRSLSSHTICANVYISTLFISLSLSLFVCMCVCVLAFQCCLALISATDLKFLIEPFLGLIPYFYFYIKLFSLGKNSLHLAKKRKNNNSYHTKLKIQTKLRYSMEHWMFSCFDGSSLVLQCISAIMSQLLGQHEHKSNPSEIKIRTKSRA